MEWPDVSTNDEETGVPSDAILEIKSAQRTSGPRTFLMIVLTGKGVTSKTAQRCATSLVPRRGVVNKTFLSMLDA